MRGFLPGAVNPERAKPFGFTLIKIVLDKAIDATAPRTSAETGSQLCEIGFTSGGHNLDLAIFSVAHPTAEIEFAGFPLNEPAKAYSLYATLN